MNFPNLRKQATIRRARQAIRSPSPIKTPDYFHGDFFTDQEFDAAIAEHQTTNESARSPVKSPSPVKTPDYFFGDFFSDDELDGATQPSTSESAEASLAETSRPTTGGKTVDEDYYEALNRQAEKYQKQGEDAITSSSPPTEASDASPKAKESDTPPTSPVVPSVEPEEDIEEDFEWYQYTSGPRAGQWTPQYAHARRAPRKKGEIITIWVERTKTFFSFPPEVRQRIYKYALFPKGIEGHAPRPYFSRNSTWKVKVPALLQASFNVRREAIPYYYNEVRLGCSETMYAKMWLSKIGKEAREALGAVTVRFDVEDQRNKTLEQQRLRFFLAFRAAGVEVRKDIVEVR